MEENLGQVLREESGKASLGLCMGMTCKPGETGIKRSKLSEVRRGTKCSMQAGRDCVLHEHLYC